MHRFVQLLSAAVPALVLGAALGSSAGALAGGLPAGHRGSAATGTGAAPAASSPGSTAAAARAALIRSSAPIPAGHLLVSGRLSPATGLEPEASYALAGYADDDRKSTTYTAAAGDWIQPAISCGKEDERVAFAVGIDGITSPTIEEAGTIAQCYDGKATYYTWWEMYPATGMTVVGSTVAAGDHIAASVTVAGTKYTLKVTDSTHPADSFSTAKTCAAATCKRESAEWVTEAINSQRGFYPLASFKPWAVTSARVTAAKAGTISSFPDDRITMIDSTEQYPLAKPSALNSSGNSFTVAWKDSY